MRCSEPGANVVVAELGSLVSHKRRSQVFRNIGFAWLGRQKRENCRTILQSRTILIFLSLFYCTISDSKTEQLCELFHRQRQGRGHPSECIRVAPEG